MTPNTSPFADRLASSDIVLRSWQRSAAAGVPPDAPAAFRRVSDDDLRRRLTTESQLIAVAVPHLRWLAATFDHRPRVAYLVDRDGIVLHAEGDQEAIQTFGLSPGFDWSEATMGTNGAGTALASQRAVAVVGCDHWSSAWSAATCLGAPIFDREKRVIGAIDLSLDVQDGDADRLILSTYAAHAVSKEIAWRSAEADARLNAEMNRRKDAFIATLGHELRQPLAAIAAALGLMRARGDSAVADRARGVFERQIAQLTRLTDDLLDAGRLSAGKVRLARQPLRLDALLAECVNAVVPAAGQQGLSIVYAAPDTAVRISGDAGRLQQVFSNVLTNAIRFTPAGTITVRVESDASHARVRIRDTGRGIAPSALPYVFEMFAQADPGTGGLGIGLAVSRALVEAHGGTIEALSDGLGKGSEVVVSLPVETARAV